MRDGIGWCEPSRANTRACDSNTLATKEVPVTREYVGIDLHRRRSVIVRKNAEGEVLG
ncbi:MAG: hypothetical protein QOG64_1392, partial [Acidimicrobiaceae bacterium]|nr:hypothetical protein [Acidimicrobiaceae bacterium]